MFFLTFIDSKIDYVKIVIKYLKNDTLDMDAPDTDFSYWILDSDHFYFPELALALTLNSTYY
ncbi:MAG: hypothetical protein A2V93_08625 [Ignavibacteria bacterium RBG_16_34_14]|nr:MAG: hypothetical protein A2V93_08625 [Ignavibacteria bacterium RBG_16_34_14]